MRRAKVWRSSLGFRRALLLSTPLFLCCSAALSQANRPSLDDYFRHARELEKREDYAGAERVYQEAARNYPNQPEILKRLGIVYQTELKFRESLDAFQKVLHQAPQYPDVNFYEGLSYFGLNQYEKAVDAFNRELHANPRHHRARYYLAQAYRSLNRNADALRQYEILLQDNPNDAEVLYQLIRFYKNGAIQTIDRLGNLDPESIYMHVLKAEGYADERKYPEAIANYRAALKQDSNFPGLHFALGETLWKNVDYPGAKKELRLALQEDPNHPLANYYLGDILLKSQRAKEAIPLLKIAVTSNPPIAAAYYELGKCYVTEGMLEDALKVLLKAVELDPNDKSTHYQLAQVYVRLKQPDKEQYHMEIFRKLYAREREKKAKQERKSVESTEVGSQSSN